MQDHPMVGEEDTAMGLMEPKIYAQSSRPSHKHHKRRIVVGFIAVLIVVVLAVILGTVFGLRSHNSNTSSSSPPSSTSSPASPGNPSATSLPAAPPTTLPAATLQASLPVASTPPILESFVSFAIEFIFFPDFSGNLSSPNTLSDNLLNNIGNISGTKPYVRVGGNSQDLAIYNAALPTPTKAVWVYNPNMHPEAIEIGPSFFDGFSNFAGSKFIYGLNLKNATNSAAGWQSLMNTVPVACKALDGKLEWWEYGNEPDVYPRPADVWNDTSYVVDWHNGTDAIQQQLVSACPVMATGSEYGYVGPSLLGTTGLPPVKLFAAGLNDQNTIKQYTMHHYMGDATSPVSLQGTLMNHTNIVSKLANIATEISNLNQSLDTPGGPIPFTLDEANSLLNGASAPQLLLNVFGAALWTLDYSLYCATIGVSRVHMQQGNGFLYNSWQPIPTPNISVSTLPPYYGNIAVAAMLGNLTKEAPRIVAVPLEDGGDFVAAYASYVNGSQLAKVAVVDLHAWNSTNIDGTANSAPRPTTNYTFALPRALGIADGTSVGVQRLMAAGSDAQTGISWDGWSYAYELDEGRGVRLDNVTVGETVGVIEGTVEVEMEWSSAVVLNFA